MDFLTSFALLVCFILALCFYHVLIRSNSRHRKLPPGPYPFPIIGNILQLGQNPHQSLAKLAKTYGPIMHLKFGSIDTIVVSSPQIAKDILQTHEQAFSGRPPMEVIRALSHHEFSIAWQPAGDKWRRQRNICKEQMFSTIRLEASQGLRQDKLRKMLDYVQECSVGGLDVDIKEVAFVTTLNVISNTLFSTDFAEYGDKGLSWEMCEAVRGLLNAWGSPNIADYIPILKSIDPQGIRRDSEKYLGKIFDIFDGMIDHRLKYSAERNDFLEALLDMSRKNPSEMSRKEIKDLLLDLFVVGGDPTSGTVGWAMTELLRNPDKLSNAKKELNAVITDNKQIEESDISRLPYLQAIIKETLRRHPPAAFIPRIMDQSDIEIKGYKIPENSHILINVWAIGRDSSVWQNPDSFEPERFLNNEVDIKGQDFELIPFGSGRRICPGMPLAYRLTHTIVASLIHNFDWKLEAGIEPGEIDITEKFRISLEKAVPMRAYPIII